MTDDHPTSISLMPEEEVYKEPESKTSADRLLAEHNVKNVLNALLHNADIISTEVKKGAKSSSNIYVNKKYTGRKVTVIIWE